MPKPNKINQDGLSLSLIAQLGATLKQGEIHAHPVTGGCWIDGRLGSSLHNHHVIPRNAGGEHGPQVTICSACHDAIHDCAKKTLTVAQYLKSTDSKQLWNGAQAMLAAYLVHIIRVSEHKANSSPNKTIKIALTLRGEENAKLEYLATQLNLSKEKTIRWLIMNK